MKLPGFSTLALRAADVVKERAFFERLGFAIDGDRIDEGSIALTLRARQKEPVRLVFAAPDAKALARAAERDDLFFEVDGVESRFIEPTTGVAIALIEGEPKAAGKSSTTCGRFYELSCPVADIEAAIASWRRVGFEVTFRQPGSPWATLASADGDGKFTLGLYEPRACNHAFTVPALTFFEPDRQERLAKMKAEGHAFQEEIAGEGGATAEAILRSPAGHDLFLFAG